ncbi:MAG: cupin domain-containing protein [Dongiaceae bacterium]
MARTDTMGDPLAFPRGGNKSSSAWQHYRREQRRRRMIALAVAAGVLAAVAGIAAFMPREQMADMDMRGMTMAGMETMEAGPVQAAGRPSTVTVTQISSEKLAHVPGKSVTVEMVDFKPGAVAPEHHHAGSVTVYVISGTIRSQLGGQPAMDYKAGQSFFEPAGTVHLFAQNPSATEDARIMAIHIADDGAQLTTFH